MRSRQRIKVNMTYNASQEYSSGFGYSSCLAGKRELPGVRRVAGTTCAERGLWAHVCPAAQKVALPRYLSADSRSSQQTFSAVLWLQNEFDVTAMSAFQRVTQFRC